MFVKSYSKQETFGIDVKFDTDVNIIDETDEGLDIYEVYGLGNKVILKKFGSFVDNILDIDQASRLERRTNLMGLTLRSIEHCQQLISNLILYELFKNQWEIDYTKNQIVF